MRGNPIWNSFAAGELTPRLANRSDQKPWRNGVAYLNNMIATSHGPAIRRAGFSYLGKSAATQAAIFGYIHLVNQGYFLCVSDTPEMQIYNVSDGITPVLEQTLTTPWLVDQIYGIQAAQVPGEKKKSPGVKSVYFVQGDHQPQGVTFDPSEVVGDQWAIAPLVFTEEPGDWANEGYPSAIAFYEGRMWLAGSEGEPETLWASKSGSFLNFDTGASDKDDDALSFTLSVTGVIRWLAAAQNLMIGTVNGEHVMTSQGGVITHADVHVQQQSAYGSLDTAAELIGNIVVYVSPDGRKLRDVGYRWEENNWLSRDITFLSEHITRSNNVRQLTWAQNPDNVIWGVTSAGNAVGCTYERHYDVIGWHRHDTQGAFEATHSLDIVGTSRLMGAFKRVDGEIYYELFDQHHGQDEHGPVYLDSHVELLSPGLSISVPHLADKLVTITVDGATHPDVQLDGSGDGTLQYTGTDVHVGLSYIPTLTTLPLDYTPEEQGTSQHFMKRWNKAYVRVLDSGLPLINGKRPPDRFPATPMGTPEPARSQDIRVINQGRDRLAQITISQDLPLPLTIAAVFGEIAQEQL